MEATRSVHNRLRRCALVLLLAATVACASPSRLKDIAVIQGQGRHKLVGYGLVAGLQGTGDGDTTVLTARSLTNMLQKFGLNVTPADLKAKNMAAVIVTAELPPIAAVGTTLDVLVSSLADAKSLQGGTLLLTPLNGADGQVYAMAQGPVTIGGFNAESSGGDKVQKNHQTVGRVPNGASIVKALAANLDEGASLSLLLQQPDFTTAVRIAEAINRACVQPQHEQQPLAVALNQSTVQVAVPPAARAHLADFIMQLERLPVEPDVAARVVINERTGTVVIGRDVRIMPVAICHGGLTVEIKAETQVSQPPPLVQVNEPPPAAKDAAPAPAVVDPTAPRPAGDPAPASVRTPASAGHTVVTQQQDLSVHEEGGSVQALPEQATLNDLVTALDALGVKPRDLIAIIQALKEVGALRAELVLL